MAKPYDGPGLICPFPEKYGGGRVLLRELPLEAEREIKKRHASDISALVEELIVSSIAEVSHDIASMAGVCGEPSPRNLVPVDSDMPGRREVYAALGPRRRKLLNVAYTKLNSYDPEDLDPFERGLELVVG